MEGSLNKHSNQLIDHSKNKVFETFDIINHWVPIFHF